MTPELEIIPVFVSSTWRDLRPEREAVEEAVQRLHETKYVGMEYFGSGDDTTRQASLEGVDRSGVYVGIFGARYGSGITEAEYRRAREKGLPCFIYFKDAAAIADDGREADQSQTDALEALKEELKREHRVSTFKNPGDLAARVTADLHNWLFKKYLTPILERAARGEYPFARAQMLLSNVRDMSALGPDLLGRLQVAGFKIEVGGDLEVGGDVVGRDKITNIYHNAPAPAVSAPIIPTLHQLRAPVGDFVGREKEIEQLLAALRGGASAAITGISGMGGIGKTELAFYVAERLRDTYPDAQLVVDMRGTDNPPRDPADLQGEGREPHVVDSRNSPRTSSQGEKFMAKNQAQRIASAVLSDDREAFAALQGIANYAPANPAYKTENIKAIRDRMDDLLREATQVAAEAKRAATNAGEWEFHNPILGAKTQVTAQFGDDSDELAALGLKKKSEYKPPTRRRQGAEQTS